MASKKKTRRWKCTTKARGICPAQCNKVFTGFGPTKREAKDASEGNCRAAGCDTPGGKPHNCQCGHTGCYPTN
jgi:hypothetical protein